MVGSADMSRGTSHGRLGLDHVIGHKIVISQLGFSSRDRSCDWLGLGHVTGHVIGHTLGHVTGHALG